MFIFALFTKQSFGPNLVMMGCPGAPGTVGFRLWFPPVRTMCKVIRERFPRLKLLVGVWGFNGDPEKAKARFERTQPDRSLQDGAGRRADPGADPAESAG